MFGTRNDVPLDRDASSRFLPWLIAVMVYLATMALVVAITMNKLADRWDQGLSNSLTIQVPAGQTPADHQSTEQKLKDFRTKLAELDNVEQVDILNDAELNKLMEPWLGKDVHLQDLPIPFLVSVELEQSNVKTIDTINTLLSEKFPEASVDDHQRWLGNLLGLAKVIQMVSLLVVLLVGGAAGLMVILVTRMGLAIHKQVVELFHHMGAHDTYIATRFQLHALKLSTVGGLSGLLLAGITIASFSTLLGQANSSILPSLTFSVTEWGALLLMPIGASLIAMMTARLTVLRSLALMP
ncbi:cell division protein FtsX [Kiloniella antarctica]|uniref:Cell division protein FtsX n=1 Tax=Kiloniella antarctica TaxID=1550907 RepID=A0ABW5BFW9_9PROT